MGAGSVLTVDISQVTPFAPLSCLRVLVQTRARMQAAGGDVVIVHAGTHGSTTTIPRHTARTAGRRYGTSQPAIRSQLIRMIRSSGRCPHDRSAARR